MMQDGTPDNNGAAAALTIGSLVPFAIGYHAIGKAIRLGGTAALAAKQAGHQVGHMAAAAAFLRQHPLAYFGTGLGISTTAGLGAIALGTHLAGNGNAMSYGSTDDVTKNIYGDLEHAAAQNGGPAPDRAKIAELVQTNDRYAEHGATAGDGQLTKDEIDRVMHAVYDDGARAVAQG